MAASVDGARTRVSDRPAGSVRRSGGRRSGPPWVRRRLGRSVVVTDQPPKKKPGDAADDRLEQAAGRPVSTTRRPRPVLPCVSAPATGVGDWVGSSSACRRRGRVGGRLRRSIGDVGSTAPVSRSASASNVAVRSWLLGCSVGVGAVGRGRLRRRRGGGLGRRVRRRPGRRARRRLRRGLGRRLRGGRQRRTCRRRGRSTLLAVRLLVGADADAVPGLAEDVGAVAGRAHEHLLDRRRSRSSG